MMKLRGAKEVEEALKHLDRKMQMALLRSFNRKALKKEGIHRMAEGAHSKRGRDNIKVQSTPRAKNKSEVLVGPTSKAFVERFLDGGTKARYTKKGGFRGSIRQDKQYEKEAERTIGPVIKYVNKELGKEIERLLKSKIKSTGRKRAKINR